MQRISCSYSTQIYLENATKPTLKDIDAVNPFKINDVTKNQKKVGLNEKSVEILVSRQK